MSNLSTRLKEAAVTGLVMGVKWVIVAAIFAVAALLLMGDYAATRQRSIDAVAFINQYGAPLVQLQQQQKSAPPPADTDAPKSDPAKK